MTSTMMITLAVTLVMAVLFLWGKFPFGLVTMSCMVVLVLSGVLTLSEGFAGLVSQTVILIAAMLAMAGALRKTDLPYKLQGLMGILNGKNNVALLLVMLVFFLISTSILPAEVVILLILSVVTVLPEDSPVKPSRIILPLLMVYLCWGFAVPVGIGATEDFSANAYMQGLVPDSTQLFVLGDNFKMKIIPTLVACVYFLFIWKKLPVHEINMEGVSSPKVEKSNLKLWQQVVVYVGFIAVIVVMLFNSYFGTTLMYTLPAAFVCIYGFTGILTPKEIVAGCASDVVWMLGGILGVTTALTNSGAAEAIGNALLPLISWTDNGFIILLIISTFTGLMTTFLSNSGTRGVLIPLVTSLAVTAGIDPRSLAGCVCVSCWFAFCFPSGSTTSAYYYALGKYNPIKMLKYTVPLLILEIFATAISVSILFPPFG